MNKRTASNKKYSTQLRRNRRRAVNKLDIGGRVPNRRYPGRT